MGFVELLVLVLVVLLFFGAGKLPAIGEGLGKAVRGFKDAVRDAPRERSGPRAPEKELPPGPTKPEA